ncbi:hypothetical protein NECAME_09220 [Necator americanus]|uniref:Uncharacterized protein n=1 Tax=Necator americanus TaxID=51031 RepID=W2TFL4_NECAM|nr:hypothetical protein NECAME_09220 [Necator americanus]ETN80379.1 hypothetical protein NECAME_09220 [Necator americanus]
MDLHGQITVRILYDTGNTGNTLLVVRGCHTSLTTVVSDRSNGAAGNFYCEYDATHQMSNSKGELVSVRALVEFCSTANCNSRQSTSPNVFNDCNDQMNDNRGYSSVSKCISA